MKNLQNSDFGIFVFAPDDLATIRGESLNVTRDNVVFEAGLFAGRLSPARCFIATPMTERVHIPTDLAGITVGFYEDSRTDRNFLAAVTAFCNEVQSHVRAKSLFKAHIPHELLGLIVKVECCDWIPDDHRLKDPCEPRVTCKRHVSDEIDAFLKYNPDSISKHRLRQEHRLGADLALLRMIRVKPGSSDWKLITDMEASMFKPGFSQSVVLDAVEALKKAGKLSGQGLRCLVDWLHGLRGLNEQIKDRVATLAE